MKPTLEQFLESAARWDGEHLGIRYELSWHGYSADYTPTGIWCWYIIVTQEQFHPDDWAKLRLERQDHDFNGSKRHHWSYETFPDCDPHGEWTFGEVTTYMGRDGADYERVKVGCDYNHLFDREGGYWEGHDDLERDVKRSIEKLAAMFPNRRPRCGYSGRYDDAANFYTAINGRLVHNSQREKFSTTEWPTWLPAEASEVSA